jgi:hypothetical protein
MLKLDGLQELHQQSHFQGEDRIREWFQWSLPCVPWGNTLAVDRNEPRCGLFPRGHAYGRPPFLTGAMLPSAKHSSQRMSCASLNPARRACHRSNKTPLIPHSGRLHHTALGLQDSRGSSLRQPEKPYLEFGLGSRDHSEPARRVCAFLSKCCRSGTLECPRLGLAARSSRCTRIFVPSFDHCAPP